MSNYKIHYPAMALSKSVETELRLSGVPCFGSASWDCASETTVKDRVFFTVFDTKDQSNKLLSVSVTLAAEILHLMQKRHHHTLDECLFRMQHRVTFSLSALNTKDHFRIIKAGEGKYTKFFIEKVVKTEE